MYLQHYLDHEQLVTWLRGILIVLTFVRPFIQSDYISFNPFP